MSSRSKTLVLYQAYFNKAPIGVAVINENGGLIWSNELAQSFLAGVNMGGLILPANDWRKFRGQLVEAKPFFFPLQEQGFIFTPQALPDEACVLIWMVPSRSMDVDLITMQQDLIQQRKLANLGKMMLEMAHELSNPLTGISMGIQLVGRSVQKLRQLLAGTTIQPYVLDLITKIQAELKRITESLDKAATLRHELLSFSKPDNLQLQPYKVRDLIGKMLKGMESQPIFQNMVIHCEFSEYSGNILCDAVKLEQIFYNLLKNTHDATNGCGTVWIREFLIGNHVRLEFEDNGPGISQSVLDKVFSPFLTTKPNSGNGLGLSISQQIIHQHGGTITVYNKPQSGACFQMTFPALFELE